MKPPPEKGIYQCPNCKLFRVKYEDDCPRCKRNAVIAGLSEKVETLTHVNLTLVTENKRLKNKLEAAKEWANNRWYEWGNRAMNVYHILYDTPLEEIEDEYDRPAIEQIRKDYGL